MHGSVDRDLARFRAQGPAFRGFPIVAESTPQYTNVLVLFYSFLQQGAYDFLLAVVPRIPCKLVSGRWGEEASDLVNDWATVKDLNLSY